MLDKLERLSAASDFVVYRWLTYGKRIEGTYNRLADIRMQGIRYGEGKVWFFEAAPVLTYSGGMCRLLLRNKNIYSILSGDAAGLLSCTIPEDNTVNYTAATHTASEEVTDDSPRHRLELVRSLVTNPYLPVCNIVVPTLYRLTRRLESLNLRVTPELCAALGIDTSADQNELRDALTRSIDSIAMRTTSGFIVPAEIVYSGGTVVCDSTMVSRKSTTSIFGIPGPIFDAVCTARSWCVDTGKETQC